MINNINNMSRPTNINKMSRPTNSNYPTYLRKCKIFENLIINEFKTEIHNISQKIDVRDGGSGLLVYIVNGFEVTIYMDSKWKDIKRNIKIFIDRTNDTNNCSICLEQCDKVMVCPICTNYQCFKCMKQQLIINEGLLICPVCKDTTGHKMPKEDVLNILNKMKSRLK